MNYFDYVSQLSQIGWPTDQTGLFSFYLIAQRTVNHLKNNKNADSQQESFYEVYQKQYNALVQTISYNLPQLSYDRISNRLTSEWLKMRLFNNLSQEIKQYSLTDFVRAFLPDCVKNQKFFDVLSKLSSELSGQQFDPNLLASYLFYLLLCIPRQAPLNRAYDIYTDKFKGYFSTVTEKDFSRLFVLMNWQEMRDDTIIKAAAKEANKRLTDMMVSNQMKCKIMAEILTRIEKLKSKEVQAPAAYLSTILYGESDEFWNANAHGRIDELVKAIPKTLTFLDFLSALMSSETKSENLAECGMIMPWFRDRWKEDGNPQVCFVNAAPSFFTSWKFTGNDSITVPYETAKEPVAEVSSATVYTMDELESIVYTQKQTVLYFARGYSKEEAANHLRRLCRDNAVVYAVLPDIYKEVTVELPGYAVDSVLILPTELFKGKKTKYYVAKIIPGNKERIEARTITIKMFNQNYYLAPQNLWAKTDIFPEDYESDTGLRTLFSRAQSFNAFATKRSRPICYPFSPELSLWYYATPLDPADPDTVEVCLYLCEVPSLEQRKRNKYPRGKKIKATETWNTLIHTEEVEDWIETQGAFNGKLRQVAIGQIKQNNHNKMSMKSVWYCLCDQVEFSELERAQMMRFLRSEQGSKLIVGETSEKEVETAILQAGESMDVMAPLLDPLLELAVKKQYIKAHPFAALHAARKKQQRIKESIRALAKRSYTDEEETKIFQYYRMNCSDVGALGMIICFLTGLTPPYVAALAWKDLRNIKKTVHMQFIVNKKMTPNGEIEWETDEENCRVIPIMDLLGLILNDWMQRIKPKQDAKIVNTEKNALSAIREHIRKAERHAGITQDYINIPNMEKPMDLNSYAGSRMRENFVRKCYLACGMTDAEVHYLTLRTMPDTLSNQYVDYGHECIQERMANKLNQWGQRFKTNNEKTRRKTKFSKKPITLSSCANRTESCHIIANIHDRLTLDLDDDHDYEYRILTYSEEG